MLCTQRIIFNVHFFNNVISFDNYTGGSREIKIVTLKKKTSTLYIFP